MKSVRLIFKLVSQQLRIAAGRAIVTIAGIVASACAVVWVVSGYDALVSQFDDNAGKYLGRYDVLLIPQGPPGALTFVNDELIESLRTDVGILEVNPIHQSRVTVTRVATPGDGDVEETSLGLVVGSRPPVNGAPPIAPILVATAASDPPYELVDGSWIDDDTVVLSSGAADSLRVEVGDHVQVTTLANQRQFRVAGIVQQAREAPSLVGQTGPRPRRKGRSPRDQSDGKQSGPERGDDRLDTTPDRPGTPKIGLPSAYVQGVATNAVYMRPAPAAHVIGFVARPTLVQLALRDTVDAEQFAEAWQDRLGQNSPPLNIVDFSRVRAGLKNSRSVLSQRAQAYAASGFAALASVFIVFSLLSMGVSERTREFALLRAIGLSRLQIAAVVVTESLALAVVGWLGGLIAGYLLIVIGGQWMPSLFASGAKLGWTCLWLTAMTVFVGALAAAIIPAWKATRIQPIEAMASARMVAPTFTSQWRLAAVGLLLALSAPVPVFVLPLPDEWRIWCYSIVTYPALLIGMALMAPAVVVLTERILGVAIARLFALDPRLLTTQLSSNLWRTIGATLALSVGLVLYASTQTWGYSMLQPYLPGTWLPDVLVSFNPQGLDEAGTDAVRNTKGVAAESVAPLAIEQAKFDWGNAEAPARLKYDNAVIFGLDPAQTISGTDPLIALDFVEGDRKSVAQNLAIHHSCVISEDFAMSAGVSTGDTLVLIPPNAEAERVEYQIAGIVRLPGWHWITKFSGVRRHFVRTACMIFADRQNVMQDFHLARPEFCWMNLQPGADLTSIETEMQEIAEEFAVGNFEASGIGEITSYRPFARTTATQTVRRAITIRANDMIWGMSQLPLITLFIMSLAVVNAVIASVRSRQWEFGILRAVGASRLQLVRLVFGETLLIGFAACVLSLAFGLIAGWCGVGMAAYSRWSFFQSDPNLIIPWTHLALGFAATLALCLIAAVLPALRIGRAEPLKLLQAGRMAG